MMLDVLLPTESSDGYLILTFLRCTHMVNTFISIGGLLIDFQTQFIMYLRLQK